MRGERLEMTRVGGVRGMGTFRRDMRVLLVSTNAKQAELNDIRCQCGSHL